MELRDYLRVLRRGWPLILAFVVVGSALGIGLTVATTKVYQASVQVFVGSSLSETDNTSLNSGNSFAQDRAQSYTTIANSPRVTAKVVANVMASTSKATLNQLGLSDLTANGLASKITADAPQNKVLINLHVTDHNPQAAALLANAVANQFDIVVRETDQSGGQPVVQLTIVHPAAVPASPIKPRKAINIGLGVLLGVLFGVGVVIVRDVLDNTVKGPEDFEELGVPVLGLVPFDKRTPKIPIAFRADPHGARSEAYRQLRTNLQFINVDNAPRVIAVTSGVPGEGKSTTALNLAAALAEGGYRVCLIEADLRRPTIAKVLGLVSDVGFTTALIGKVSALDVLQNAGRNLAVLTCGPVPPNPSELLITSQARSIIREVAATVDYTIIDTAPLLPVADGAEVAAMADATLVVHHANKSTRDQAIRSIEALEKVGERPVGVILNQLVRTRANSDYAYGYYYTYRPDKVRHSDDELIKVSSNGVDASAGKAPEVSYAVADLPPTAEPTGHNQFGVEAPDFQPAVSFPTSGDAPGAGGAHAAQGSSSVHGTNGGYPAEREFDGDPTAEQGPAERWRELRGRKSRR